MSHKLFIETAIDSRTKSGVCCGSTLVLLLLIAMFSPAKRAVAARNRRGPGRRFAPLVPNAGDCDDCYYESRMDCFRTPCRA